MRANTRPSDEAARAVGAIDVGTNTVLLLVAWRAEGGGLEVLHDASVTARLGEGLAATGRLSEAGIERALAALRRHLATLEELGVPRDRTRAVGTAALRRARDAGRFIGRARAELGLEVEVLSEEDEARLGHAAVVAEGGAAETLVLDVGGGSTELVGEGGRLRLSVPIGALVATERHLPRGERAAWGAPWRELESALEDAMAAFPAGLAARAGAEVRLLGGTALNLACLDLALPAFDPARAEGHVVTTLAARAQAERLARLAPGERLRLPIEPERAEILPAGLLCIAAALERLGAREARASGRGLRYGLARELLPAAE